MEIHYLAEGAVGQNDMAHATIRLSNQLFRDSEPFARCLDNGPDRT